jgi:hypothetical protein
MPRHGQGSYLTLRHGSGKVPLSSYDYKYREGRRQRGEEKKKRKLEGAKILGNELEEENRIKRRKQGIV